MQKTIQVRSDVRSVNVQRWSFTCGQTSKCHINKPASPASHAAWREV